jgi:hypothetical protein
MVAIPALYQRAGWLAPTLMFIVCTIASSLSTTFLVESMGLLPRGERHEFVPVMTYYFGKLGTRLGTLFVNTSLSAMNVATIIVSGHVVDIAYLSATGYTCGLGLYPKLALMCESAQTSSVTPFEGWTVVSLGLITVMAVMLPLSFASLGENMFLQKASAALLFGLLALWAWALSLVGFPEHLPAIGHDMTGVVGQVWTTCAHH